MTSAELLTDAFGRVRETIHEAVDGLTGDELAVRLDPDANSIGWLCWHLTRVQDDHLAGAFGLTQVWAGFSDRFGLPFATAEIGYGHNSKEVAEVRAPAELLTEYYDAVHERTLRLVAGLTDPDLSRIVDERWDPPVSLAVRLVSVVADDLQHVGQAAYVRGLTEKEQP